MAITFNPPPIRYPQIDPSAISGLIDPYLHQRQQESLGAATSEAYSALQAEDYPRMARALQFVAGVHPATAAALMSDALREKSEKRMEAHYKATEELAKQREYREALTPVKIGQEGWMGPERFAIRPSKPGEPWRDVYGNPMKPPTAQPLTAQPGAPTTPGQEPTPGQPQQEPTPEQKEQLFLNQYDPTGELHELIRGVERYDIDPNTAIPAKSGSRPLRPVVITGASKLAQVLGHDPYKSEEFPARSSSFKLFNTKILPQQLKPISAAFEHANTASQAMAALNNGDVQLANTIWNRWRAATGAGEPAGAAISAKIIGAEAAKAMAGAMSGVSEREEYGTLVNPNASPQAQQAALGALEQFMGEQMLVIKQGYQESTHRKDFDRYLMPRARAFAGQLEKEHAGEVIDPTKMGFGRTRQQPQQQPQQQMPSREQAIAQAQKQIALAPNDPNWRAQVLGRLRQFLSDPNFNLPAQ